MIIDTSIDTTFENMDVATYFLLQDIQEKKKQIKRIDKDYLENEEYIKLQFEEMKLQKEEYELF